MLSIYNLIQEIHKLKLKVYYKLAFFSDSRNIEYNKEIYMYKEIYIIFEFIQ